MSLKVCLDVVYLVYLHWYTNFFLYSKFVHEFLKFDVHIFSFVLILCMNLYANSHVNFVHEIRTKLIILGRTWKKFIQIYENL